MNHILLVDDDAELVEMVREYLVPEGFNVDAAYDYASGLEAALSGKNELIVLDVMLPGGSGFDLLRGIRTKSSVPVLLLTARGDAVDRVVGLEIGADDYVPKPCDPHELVARIRAVLRRTRRSPEPSTTGDWIHGGDVALSPALRKATCRGQELDLTSVEFNVLEYLLRRRGTIVSREELVNGALGRRIGAFDRSIDVHVSRLRRKFLQCGVEEDRIKAVRGAGYVYAALPSEANT